MPQADRFLRACRREAVDVTPIWLMRQAGRYMAEYRALRQRYSIVELIRTPELVTEVTLQPINAFNLDAAIIFADILPPLIGMGLSLEFVKGDGLLRVPQHPHGTLGWSGLDPIHRWKRNWGYP